LSWLETTLGELAKALASLESVRDQTRSRLTEPQVHEVWEDYVYIEKAVAFVKIELGVENPNRFINAKPYLVPDERQAMSFASRELASALQLLRQRDLSAGLKRLRESRNYLRFLLRRKALDRRNAASHHPGRAGTDSSP
jgi:hypothetical protein